MRTRLEDSVSTVVTRSPMLGSAPAAAPRAAVTPADGPDGRLVDLVAALPHTADEVEAAMRPQRIKTR